MSNECDGWQCSYYDNNTLNVTFYSPWWLDTVDSPERFANDTNWTWFFKLLLPQTTESDWEEK